MPPIQMNNDPEWLRHLASMEDKSDGIVSVGGLIIELGYLPDKPLKEAIIALHHNMFEANYYSNIDLPRAQDKYLDALLATMSCANTLALHYQVDLKLELNLDKVIIMLADKGKPEPENLAALEAEWQKQLDLDRNLL